MRVKRRKIVIDRGHRGDLYFSVAVVARLALSRELETTATSLTGARPKAASVWEAGAPSPLKLNRQRHTTRERGPQSHGGRVHQERAKTQPGCRRGESLEPQRSHSGPTRTRDARRHLPSLGSLKRQRTLQPKHPPQANPLVADVLKPARPSGPAKDELRDEHQHAAFAHDAREGLARARAPPPTPPQTTA
jgi:hypothetical protein